METFKRFVAALSACAFLLAFAPVVSAQRAPAQQCERLRDKPLRFRSCVRAHNRRQKIKKQCAGLSGSNRRSCVRAVVKSKVSERARKRRSRIKRRAKDKCNLATEERIATCKSRRRADIKARKRYPGDLRTIRSRRAVHVKKVSIDAIRTCRKMKNKWAASACVRSVREKSKRRLPESGE